MPLSEVWPWIVETGLLTHRSPLKSSSFFFGKFYPIQLTTIICRSFCQFDIHVFKNASALRESVIFWDLHRWHLHSLKKRDANKTTWPFGHSQISSERAAEHFLEFCRFKFQKTNGSSMYRIHVSYWGHVRNTISYIQLTQLGTVSPHFCGWDPTTTANVTPVETRTVTSPGRHVFLEVARALRACDFGHVGRLCREWLCDSTCGSPRKVTWKAGTYTGNEDVCPTESGDFAMAC